MRATVVLATLGFVLPGISGAQDSAAHHEQMIRPRMIGTNCPAGTGRQERSAKVRHRKRSDLIRDSLRNSLVVKRLHRLTKLS